ncbi:unnamed protein product [Blepharisma stoltei]|uniref:Male-enhanced antigen 1 n=1 Tax=Blepharisma stoltei TaxID=1481888 RepID=A0AAU9I8B9_9CILI|nr:unnamed protein product [Blepharisma stoltei]
MNSEPSESDPVEAINRELDGKLEGIDVDGIIDRELSKLDLDYAITVAATIDPIECFQESVNASSSQDWEASFDEGEEEPQYQICPSESDSDEGEEKTDEKLPEVKRDIPMTPEKVEQIKNIMKKIQMPHPFWAKNIPDQRWVEMMKKRANVNS